MATYKLVDEEKLDASMTATADAIRAKTGSEDAIPWNMDTGMAEAVEPVFEAGKKARLKEFWDDILHNGERTHWSIRAFAGTVFNPKNFYPTHDIVVVGVGDQMFYDWSNTNYPEDYYESWSLAQRLKECGVVLDVSQATSLSGMFAYSYVGEIPTLDVRSCLTSRDLFAHWYDKNKTIEKIITNENVQYTDWFLLTNVTNITFEGIIGNDINFHRAHSMTKDSILSVVSALSDTTTDKTVTLSLTAVNTAFETTAGAADGSTSEEWTTLIATKSNWTISLV